MSEKVVMTGTFILIRRLDEATPEKSLILPKGVELDQLAKGVIVAAGVACDLQPGDKIVFPNGEVGVRLSHNGCEHQIIDERNVYIAYRNDKESLDA